LVLAQQRKLKGKQVNCDVRQPKDPPSVFVKRGVLAGEVWGANFQRTKFGRGKCENFERMGQFLLPTVSNQLWTPPTTQRVYSGRTGRTKKIHLGSEPSQGDENVPKWRVMTLRVGVRRPATPPFRSVKRDRRGFQPRQSHCGKFVGRVEAQGSLGGSEGIPEKGTKNVGRDTQRVRGQSQRQAKGIRPLRKKPVPGKLCRGW